MCKILLPSCTATVFLSKKLWTVFSAYIVLDSYYVSCAMKDWYSIWNNNPYTARFARYYSMTLKSWMWINGKALHQQEEVWPEVGVMQFGTENTGCQLITKTTITHVRSSQLLCNNKSK